MATATATILIDQADDPEVRFSRSTQNEVTELVLTHRTAPVATVVFMSDQHSAERFALWLESVAALIRSEAELVERDEQLEAAGAAALDLQIWGR